MNLFQIGDRAVDPDEVWKVEVFIDPATAIRCTNIHFRPSSRRDETGLVVPPMKVEGGTIAEWREVGFIAIGQFAFNPVMIRGLSLERNVVTLWPMPDLGLSAETIGAAYDQVAPIANFIAALPPLKDHAQESGEAD